MEKQAESVAVVIPTYNHARYLGDALDSIFAQTIRPTEIIVVDDGSDDNPSEVVAQYPSVFLLQQANLGLAAARNAGAAVAQARFILFLDADDVLSPGAIASGLSCMRKNPGAAFVYGAHRRVNEKLEPTGGLRYMDAGTNPYLTLLRCNSIGMHATVMYDREVLMAAGGFDPLLPRCEDYDVYLRLARAHPVYSHSALVADYRWHESNMSQNPLDMLAWVLRVHKRHHPRGRDLAAIRAWREGRRIWRDYYGELAWTHSTGHHGWIARSIGRIKALKAAPTRILRKGVRRVAKATLAAMPEGFAYRIRKAAGRSASPPVGKVRMADLQRIRPISPDFGFDRGTPVDRHYIEGFLAQHSQAIQGRTLEIGDATYCTRFDNGITHQDILHISPDDPNATIIGDLAQDDVLPRDTFDCQVITQTLHLIYDMKSAVQQLHDALRPGGVLLLTVPGITSIDRGEWGDTWYWSLTRTSAARLLGDVFGPENITISVFGNAYSATCFIQGMALEEVEQSFLDVIDPSYPVIIGVRAVRGRA